MSQMTKKKRNHQIPCSKKQVTVSPCRQWPNLPSQLINSIARQPNHLMQNITSLGSVITKSWRSTPRQCSINSPWPKLVEINRKDHYNARSHIFEIRLHEEYPYPYYKRRQYKRTDCPGIYFKGCSHGNVFVLDKNFSLFSLWNPCTRSYWCLPSWDLKLPIKLATSSSKSDARLGGNVLMVLTGISSPAFAFYRLRARDEHVWIKENFNIKEPYAPGECMQFCNAIGFKGKFYALSLQGSLVVIEDDIGSCFRITGVSRNRAIPSKKSRQYREYLVESNGEILLVFLISRKSIDSVDDVEVFRLDVLRLLWVKVESLGAYTLFLEDECCMGVYAGEVGCRKNCIYFTHDRLDEWLVFEMETKRILPCSGESSMWDEAVELDS